MIVAITGGTGFIGRRLVLRHFACGDEVRVFSRRSSAGSGLPDSVVWMTGSLTDSSNLMSFVDGVDVLYHCAAENNNASKMIDVNVGGTKKLVRAARGRIRHWVQLSSVSVYGTHADGEISEETPIKPLNIYELSKAAAEDIVIEAAAKGDFSCSVLRPSKVYGLGMSNRILFQLISLLDRRIFFFIGRPGALANYIHVDNVVEALFRCGTMDAAKGKTYNLSDHCTIGELVAIIASALGKPVPTIRLPLTPIRLFARILGWIPGFPLTISRVNALTRRVVYVSTRIQDELGYRHPVSLDAGFRQLVEAWKRTS